MENLDKYNELLLTKNLEEKDYELFRTRCKKRLGGFHFCWNSQLMATKKLSFFY